MTWRRYDPKRDLEPCRRIWYETGWLRPDRPVVFDTVAAQGPAYVTDLEGEPECLVVMSPGTLRYRAQELGLTGVMAVTTSRVGRRQGLAGRLTARAVAEQASAGAAVAGLGMFDQGYYDKLGFGSGGYEHIVALDPLALDLGIRPRKATRLGPEHAEAIHASRTGRTLGHGGVNFASVDVTRADMLRSEHGFGLGYFEGGLLTHHLWALPETDNRMHGPFRVLWLSYRNGGQLKELLSLLSDLGDQVMLVRLREPPGIQLQDLVERPMRHYHQGGGARFEPRNDARAYWQMRICDLDACVRAVRIREELSFNLVLDDPIAHYLDEGSWRGVGGEYVVRLGPASAVRPGRQEGLKRLEAGVGAFTRLWLGVRSAGSLAVTDNLRADPELLAALDEALLLPEPRPDWDF